MTFEWKEYIINKGSIGKGSYSKVYSGYNKETKLEIALKKIIFNKLHDNVKDKVISEINIMQKMNHPNIIKLYEYKFEGDYILLITEYCKDKDMDTWLQKEHSIDEIKDVIKQIVCGIEYMHSNNILHRDIKPQNILFHGNMIKICDFGFSTIIKDSYMMLNTICGTPLFMSPELLFLKPYTMKSEIWALGVLFYMMLYKVHPFGRLISLDDYRIKINNMISFKPIDGMDDIIEIIKSMLLMKEKDRPDIKSIMKMLNIPEANNIPILELPNSFNEDVSIPIKIKTIDSIASPVIEPMSEKSSSQNIALSKFSLGPTSKDSINRINELENEVFRLESIIKEKEKEKEDDYVYLGKSNKSYVSCCFNNDEYENIKPDYFSPPSNPIDIPNISRKNSMSAGYSNSPVSSFSPGSSGKKKSFLSSSIEKITSFFKK
jgi:serine/threonine protein kinase